MTSHAGSRWPHHSLPAWPSCPWAQITSLQNWSPHDGRPFYAFTNLDNFFPRDLLSTPTARHSSWNSCENFEKLFTFTYFRGLKQQKRTNLCTCEIGWPWCTQSCVLQATIRRRQNEVANASCKKVNSVHMTLARSGDMINAMPHEKSYTLMHMTLARSFMLQTSSRDMRIADPTPVQQSFCVHLHLHWEGNETITVTFF